MEPESLWALSVLVPLAFFSVSTGKLAYYLLPCCPPAALLASAALLRPRGGPAAAARASWLRWPLSLLAAGCSLLALALLAWESLGPRLAGSLEPEVQALVADIRTPVAAALLVLAAGSGAGAWLARRRGMVPALAAYALGFVGFLGVVPWILRGVETLSLPRRVAAEIARHERPGEPVVVFGHYYRGIPFYLGHPVVLWQARHAEFGHPITERDRPFALDADRELLLERVHAGPSALLVASDPEDEDLLRELLTCPLEPLATVAEVALLRSTCAGDCAPGEAPQGSAAAELPVGQE